MMTDADKLIAFLSTDAKDPAKPLLRVGEIVGNWRILSFLGGGGFGEVYRVIHIHVGIVCALKILKNETENARKRFQREATFVAKHDGLGIPRFFEIGTIKGNRPYFVMEMLTPRELPSSGRAVANLLKSLCQIVGALHREGYVHRDIKPSNILYRDNGGIVLVDYGLIKRVDCAGVQHVALNSLTRANVAVGTERYAAPEQLTGNSIDCHADIHALGVLIDTCFHGRIPWRWRNIVCRATSSLSDRRYSSCAALSCAITWRFASEFAIAVCSFIALAIVAICLVIHRQKIHDRSEDLSTSAFVTNVEKSVEAKNVSDSAWEWMMP